eukprot:4756345-Pyramimonas_sp.AAC.1
MIPRAQALAGTKALPIGSGPPPAPNAADSILSNLAGLLNPRFLNAALVRSRFGLPTSARSAPAPADVP